jgi:ATP-dependent protease HslVU (ClpYQ) peptidase subunit
MTCIAAVAKDGKVYMGGDSAMTDEGAGIISRMHLPKVFIKGEYIVGYAGSARFGKLMQHVFIYPDVPARLKTSEQLDAFLNGLVVTSLRKQAQELSLEKEEKEDFQVLVGLRGHLFEFDEDWAMFEVGRNYNAIGSGAAVALGSLFTTEVWKDPNKRIRVALEAASLYTPYVGEPFDILSI